MLRLLPALTFLALALVPGLAPLALAGAVVGVLVAVERRVAAMYP